jgi:hypothetical protein
MWQEQARNTAELIAAKIDDRIDHPTRTTHAVFDFGRLEDWRTIAVGRPDRRCLRGQYVAAECDVHLARDLGNEFSLEF